MSDFTPKSKVICQEEDWCNAFGDIYIKCQIGERFTITGTKYVGGSQFLEFKEHPGLHFLANGFTPLRRYN